MNAKKCDHCGKYYDSYGMRNDSKSTNAVMFVNVDENGHYFSHGVIDLCPECMNEAKEFVKANGGTE